MGQFLVLPIKLNAADQFGVEVMEYCVSQANSPLPGTWLISSRMPSGSSNSIE
jgi:hypothetical protein